MTTSSRFRERHTYIAPELGISYPAPKPERTGRHLGSEAFVEKAGVLVGRDLQKKKPGRKVREG